MNWAYYRHYGQYPVISLLRPIESTHSAVTIDTRTLYGDRMFRCHGWALYRHLFSRTLYNRPFIRRSSINHKLCMLTDMCLNQESPPLDFCLLLSQLGQLWVVQGWYSRNTCLMPSCKAPDMVHSHSRIGFHGSSSQ